MVAQYRPPGGEPRRRVCIRVFEEGVGHHKVVVDARAEEPQAVVVGHVTFPSTCRWGLSLAAVAAAAAIVAAAATPRASPGFNWVQSVVLIVVIVTIIVYQ